MSSKSQLNQDINVLKYYNYKRNGFFIEIGASDGNALSNTYILEKNYDWDGICVEPIPSDFALLKNNRNCKCSNDAVYSVSNQILPFAVKNFNMCSGIINTLDNEVIIDNKVYNRSLNHDLKEIINVNTISLNDLLIKFNAPNFIDYLSLDTEGSEYEILKTFDFNRFKIGMIDVEHNFIEPRRTFIKELLESNNYKLNMENNFDDNYILLS